MTGQRATDRIAVGELKIDALFFVTTIECAASVEPDVVSVDVVTAGAGTVKSDAYLRIAGDDVALCNRNAADRVRRGFNPDAALLR